MEPITLTFAEADFDMHGRCNLDNEWVGDDWVEIYDGSSTHRYPRCGELAPGTVNGTTITVKLHTDDTITASGFFAVVTGDVTVTSDVTCES